VKKEQARRRLPVVAVDVYHLVHTFDGDAAVQSLKAFGLLRRLFEEQCEVVEGDDDIDRDGDAGDGSGRNIVECAKRGIDLQAPVHDPAAPPAVDAFIAAGEPDRGVPTAAAAAEPATDAAVDAAAAEPVPDAGSSPAPLDDDRLRGQLPGRLDLASFAFNAAFSEVLSCPDGLAPAAQHVANGVLIASFAAAPCRGCPLSTLCPTRELADGSRQLRRAPATIATEVRQREQRTRRFEDRYRSRKLGELAGDSGGQLEMFEG